MCGPRLLSTFDPEGDTFRYVRDNLTDVQLEAADGSGALMIVKTIRVSVGPKSTQESVRLLLDFFRLDSLRRNHGETMRHWTRRFTLQSRSSFHRIQMNILVVFLWLVKQDWCEAILEQMCTVHTAIGQNSCKRDYESGILETNSCTDVLFSDD